MVTDNNKKMEIKRKILDRDYNIDELLKELQSDFDTTTPILLNVSSSIIRRSNNKDYDIIDDILSILNKFIYDDDSNTKYLDKLHKKINAFLDNLEKNTKNNKQNETKDYLMKFFDIQNKCLLLSLKKNKTEKYFFINYLIFEKKNILVLNRYMQDNMKTLENSTLLPAIFMEVILRFISLDSSNKSEIKYYNQVINLFLRGKAYTNLLSSNQMIMKVLERIDKDFVRELVCKLKNDLNMTREEVAKEYNVSFIFPDNLENITYNGNNITDFTKQNIITIDAPEDKCLDDALYIEKNTDGTYTFYIHLANVPSIIPYSSNVMKEALTRGETIFSEYFDIHIFEEYLANDLLSIIPGKKTNTFTFVMKVDTDYTILLDTVRIVPGVVINKNKLSYDMVDDILEDKYPSEVRDILINLSNLMGRLSKDNLHVRALHQMDNILSNNDNTNSAKAHLSKAHNMVENSMIFANRLPDLISKYFKLSLPLVYRVQPVCNDEYIELVAKDINYPGIKNAHLSHTIRSFMGSAYYASEDVYHNGLKINGYARISSPARRALDALNEFIIYDLYINRDAGDLDGKYYFWEREVDYWCYRVNKKIEENNSFMNQYSYLHSKGKILKR